jgi:hypothetical protein
MYSSETKKKKNYNEVKDEEMGRACSTTGREKGMHTKFWWGSQKERGHQEDKNM